ncbi:glycosyltransferase family 2 protein [Magnetospirillum sp. UT-4]|uniref:glycosyltransferase family 2 protein n=1 Tax=Magnetospirillum sp. UT-4 TaxID=2681467 RepID=UPI001383E1C4|nr:glycosyltransferase family 2 protein [Magnetospirillum sp. UT-4]CAA7612084.1 Glycosyltransferases involved in cell wall biogenesis [Magnetospirillum sp. UT-4]
MKLSALVVAHNEEKRLAACLETLAFADELVVVCDKCTDSTPAIARSFGAQVVEGSWDIEGDRRNTGINACTGDWILEVDADEHVPPALAAEIRRVIEASRSDWHEILVDNYIGERLVRHGWGASYGKAAYPGLFRKGAKVWGRDRVHPSLTWTGSKGAMLKNRLDHYVDRDISDMIRRLDSYSTAKARDLRDKGETWGSTASNLRRLVSRFFKCYVRRGGWREGGYGFIIAVCAGLYPLLSHFKAKYEKE